MTQGVEVGQNRQDREDITNKVAACVAQKRPGLWKVIRQKTEQRAKSQKGEEPDEILPLCRGYQRKVPRTNGAQACAETVHIVHEVKRINHRQYPEYCYRVAEENVRNEKRNPRAAGGHKKGDSKLPRKLRS